jgi:hypothetical protein
MVILEMEVLWTICLGWPWTEILSVSASQELGLQAWATSNLAQILIFQDFNIQNYGSTPYFIKSSQKNNYSYFIVEDTEPLLSSTC